MAPVARWLLRITLAALLVIAYFTVWEAVRNGWGQSVVYPVLSRVAHISDSHRASPSGRQVSIIRTLDAGGETRFSVLPPAGVKFLLPAIFLVLVAPTRPAWAYFGAGHLLLSAVAIGGGAALIIVPQFGEPFLAFVQSYLVDVYSLTVPILVYARHRSRHL
jgi:hypothetical protein